MTDRREEPREEPAAEESPTTPAVTDRRGGIPRDLPDQQADTHAVSPDPWDVGQPRKREPAEDRGESREEEAKKRGDDVPDTDESGTGRRGSPQSGGVHPQQPVPQEPSG
jgi:hypothetical protein